MYGIYRYLLATFVVLGHFSDIFTRTTIVPGAVYGFYILSGYLMTSIINSTYGKDLKGTKKYLLNRLVRIYPTYWLVLIFTLLLVLILGSEVTTTSHPLILLPNNLFDLISNIILFGIINPFNGELSNVVIVPPAWALVIELIFYTLIPLIGRNKGRALAWLLISIIISIVITLTNQSIYVRYHSIFAATLAFSAGSYLFYFLKENSIGKKIVYNHKILIIVIMLYIFNYMLTKYDFRFFPVSFGFSLILSIIITALLSRISKNSVPKSIYRIDKFLGGLSYPIYLSHYTVSIIISVLFYNGLRPSLSDDISSTFCILVLIMTNLFSILIYVYFESYIQIFRDKIRGFAFNS